MAQEQLRAWQARLADIAGSGIGRALSRALGAVALDAEREAKLNATKAGKYLTQPIGPALTAAGVPKFTSARQVPGLRFIRSKAGTPLLVDAQGTLWYVLHTRVKIKPKRYLRDAIATARGKPARGRAAGRRNELLAGAAGARNSPSPSS